MSDHWNIVDFKDVHKFTHELNQYRRGETSDADFLPLRLANGIYGQRQDDAYMVRIKLPAGVLNINQLNCISDLVEKYSSADFANVTTRQDIQLHFVPSKNLSKVLLRLADAGLTTREACGNTVRNVTACPLAGQCDKEITDVRPVLNDTVEYFMRHPLTQFMPRKVKMSFSGCEQDCAMGMIHDVGVVAVSKNGEQGFKVLVGGGLGHKPRKSIVLEEFVSKEAIIPTIESIITVHNRYSDRKKRAKSRIKFLIDKFGAEGFREKYSEVLKDVSEKMQNVEQPGSKVGKFCSVPARKKDKPLNANFGQLELKLDIGDITPQQIKLLSGVMVKHKLSKLRTTQSQNLVITEIPVDIFQSVTKDMENAEINCAPFFLHKRSDVVACPGEWTCRLGITSSRGLAKKLLSGDQNLRVHVSGCHNGCAQPQLADIGLHGEARRMFGKLIPYYRLYFAGDGMADGDLALKGPEVPAARAEYAIKLVKESFNTDKTHDTSFFQWARDKGVDYFNELLKDLLLVTADDLPSLMRDVDGEGEFKVLQLGGGECAGISEETVASQLAEMSYEKEYRNIFVLQSKISAALDCTENMLTLVGKSILFHQGQLVERNINEIINKMNAALGEYPFVYESFEKLASTLQELRVTENAEKFSVFSSDLDDWISRVTSDQNRISIESFFVGKPDEEETSVIEEALDLSQEVCPMHYIKARQALKNIDEGQVLKIIVKSGEDQRLVSKSLESVGFNLLEAQDGMDENVILHVEKPVVVKQKNVASTAVA